MFADVIVSVCSESPGGISVLLRISKPSLTAKRPVIETATPVLNCVKVLFLPVSTNRRLVQAVVAKTCQESSSKNLAMASLPESPETLSVNFR